MKNMFFKTLSVLVVGFLITGSALAQEEVKEETKKESKITIKVVKDGETVLDSTFVPSEGMDHEKIRKLIKKFSGDEISVDWYDSSETKVFGILKGMDSKAMKMKMFTDEDFNFEFDGEAFGDSSVFIWKSDSGDKNIEFFGKGNFTVFEEDGKHGVKIVRIESKSGHSHGIDKMDNVIVIKKDRKFIFQGDTDKVHGNNEFIIKGGTDDNISWISDKGLFFSNSPKKKEHIELKPIAYGVYRLEFNSEELEPILIEVFNSEGERLFKKKVKNFYGRFIKEIELAGNEIAFFSVRVVQGDKEIIGEFEFK